MKTETPIHARGELSHVHDPNHGDNRIASEIDGETDGDPARYVDRSTYVADVDAGSNAESFAYAARLVACWNACQGMADPVSEVAKLRRPVVVTAKNPGEPDKVLHMQPGDEVTVRVNSDALLRQRDELAAALDAYVRKCCGQVYDDARAVLAKVQL